MNLLDAVSRIFMVIPIWPFFYVPKPFQRTRYSGRNDVCSVACESFSVSEEYGS